MKKLLRKLLGIQKKTNQSVIDHLRRSGALIGEDLYIYAPNHTLIDSTCAYLLSIGDHVRIAEGAKILTHDYAWSALKGYASDTVFPGCILGAQSPVEIGNHVFIGMNAIITRGVKIGDHVIIGAGSVVTRDCESNAVYAGNPARKICTMDEFYRKRQALQFSEARTIAHKYRERYGQNPPIEIFHEYFMLFATREQAEGIEAFRAQMGRMGTYRETAAYMDAHAPMFNGFEAFLSACFDEDAKM